MAPRKKAPEKTVPAGTHLQNCTITMNSPPKRMDAEAVSAIIALADAAKANAEAIQMITNLIPADQSIGVYIGDQK